MVRFRPIGLRRRGAALWIVCGLAAPAFGANADAALAQANDAPSANVAADAIDDRFDFDIPAQPLASALDRYAALTHRSVVFRDALVSGRTSSPVVGRYPSKTALQALLADTGLVADDPGGDQGGKDAFVLKPAAVQPEPEPLPHAAFDRRYDALIQARVWQALCADPRTVPGKYRAVLQLRVDGAGRLGQARLLVASGDARRDAAMLAILAGLRIDSAPPPDLAQPLTLAILPRAGGADCETVHRP
jgi:hypothetical protein